MLKDLTRSAVREFSITTELRRGRSFPNSVWERTSAKLCFESALAATYFRFETEFRRQVVPKQSLGTRSLWHDSILSALPSFFEKRNLVAS